MTATRSIEHVIAKQALHDLVATYARGVDRADATVLASVFHPDAQVVTGIIDGLAPDYARDVVAMLRANVKSTFHSHSNEYFEISDDTASGETYVLAHLVSAGVDPEETLTGGRYLDRYEKRDGIWKIAHRTFVTDWTSTRPAVVAEGDTDEESRTRGRYAPGDPSTAFWAGAA